MVSVCVEALSLADVTVEGMLVSSEDPRASFLFYVHCKSH